MHLNLKDTKKEYVVYTKNEKDANGNVTVYVSRIERNGETPQLYGVDNEEEWIGKRRITQIIAIMVGGINYE